MKKVYIISHSHWDREWYLSYERHHMRLIQLMDDLLELFEKDPDFDSFHLDGQTIILDDYLQVRPEKKEAVKKAVQSGKLRIGPFYILQDAFLVSPEANVRNMLIGHKESEKWGASVKLGYFPDTFGNMGQTPQLMKKAGLDAAAFGRGVKPIGFANEILEDENYTSQYSEMWWKGPDQTEIFGLLFANWYSNGNEIPSDEEQAKLFWDQKLADAEKFASTDHLLMMNGVDHQPVQKDISKAIALANKLYPEYEFIHSNFTDYLAALKSDLPEEIGQVAGELTSQETDGWYTLANTASSRVYLKQWNTRVQRQLENITEPLATIAYEQTGKYPHDQLDYAWKTLMQNHPHDSICGCSIDDVHREMITRFEKADQVGKFLAEKALKEIGQSIDTKDFPKNSYPFTIFNTSGFEKTGEVSITIELTRKTFAEGAPPFLYDELEKLPLMDYHVETKDGEYVPAEFSPVETVFGYELPDESFRIPYVARVVTVTLPIHDMPAFSWETFALAEGAYVEEEQEQNLLIQNDGWGLENEWVQLAVQKNGSLEVKDKESGEIFSGLHVFEDTGDIGNEYVYKKPENTQPILSTKGEAVIQILKNSPEQAQIKISQNMLLPASADEQLTKEQQMMVEFRERKAQRSEEKAIFPIETVITLRKNSRRIDFETKINNQMKDHRLRILFPTKLHVEHHEADSIFEVVKRPNQVSSSWKNPENPQHQHAFVNLHDEKISVTVGNYGLNEYEGFSGDTIALTLLRCVGELGDWGYFATPEAQCLGKHIFHYSLEITSAKERYTAYKHAYAAQIPFSAIQLPKQEGKEPSKKKYLETNGKTFAPTALKRGKMNEAILRGYNMSEKEMPLTITKQQKNGKLLNLLEEDCQQTPPMTIYPHEIRTIGFEEETTCTAE